MHRAGVGALNMHSVGNRSRSLIAAGMPPVTSARNWPRLLVRSAPPTTSDSGRPNAPPPTLAEWARYRRSPAHLTTGQKRLAEQFAILRSRRLFRQKSLPAAFQPVRACASAKSAPAASSMVVMLDISSAIRPAPARSDDSFNTR